jgi:hypothetical protein
MVSLYEILASPGAFFAGGRGLPIWGKSPTGNGKMIRTTRGPKPLRLVLRGACTLPTILHSDFSVLELEIQTPSVTQHLRQVLAVLSAG